MQNKITIGVSKLSPNYASWLNKLQDGIEIIDYSDMSLNEVTKHIHSVSGVLLTGGNDIHPGLYGRDEDIAYCKGIDARRDELESKIIELVFKFNIPLLGICRGQQILNVVRKGTLYADIPSFIDTAIIHANEKDVYHAVTINHDSRLFRLTGVSGGTVNSAHHQAVNIIASGFLVSAFSPDGLIEAIETESAVSHSFCIAVQWHPERMDITNPLSGMLGKGFIEVMKRGPGRQELR
jgi:putative glutamine amidotransferase